MNNAKTYPDEECCKLCRCYMKDHEDRLCHNGSCPCHSDTTKHEMGQSIKHAMNKQNDNKVEPKLQFGECCKTCNDSLNGYCKDYECPCHTTPVTEDKNGHKKECGCVEVGMGPYPRYCAKHLKENVPSTDVSWESDYWKQWGDLATHPLANGLLDWIRNEKQLSFDAGGKTVGGTGRVMYMAGRKEAIAEIRGQIEKLLEGENRQTIRVKYITEDKALNTEFDIALKAILSLEALSNK